jgi:hypothetical protein
MVHIFFLPGLVWKTVCSRWNNHLIYVNMQVLKSYSGMCQSLTQVHRRTDSSKTGVPLRPFKSPAMEVRCQIGKAKDEVSLPWNPTFGFVLCLKASLWRQFAWMFVCFFSGTGVWTQGFVLAKQAFTTWTTSSTGPFCSGYFGDEGLMNYFPRTLILLISASQVARIVM